MRQHNSQSQSLAGAANEDDIWSIDAPCDSLSLPPEPAEAQSFRPWGWVCAVFLTVAAVGSVAWLDHQARADEHALYLYAQARAAKALPVIHALAFAPTGGTVAGGCADGTVRLWDAATGKELRVFRGLNGSPTTLAFSPNGEMLAAACADRPHQNGEALVWDVATGNTRQALDVAGKPVTALAFSQNGHVLATSYGPGQLTLWDTETWRALAQFDNHQEALALAFSPDGETLAVADADGRLRIWNLLTGKARPPRQSQDGVVCCMTFSPDGRTLAATGSNGNIYLWDVGLSRIRRTLHIVPDFLPVRAMAFSPDGQRLALGIGDWHRPGQLYVWNVGGNDEPVVLRGHLGMIYSIAFAPDGRTIASGCSDQIVRLWNVADGTEQLEIRVAAPDGASASSP